MRLDFSGVLRIDLASEGFSESFKAEAILSLPLSTTLLGSVTASLCCVLLSGAGLEGRLFFLEAD